MDISNRLGGRWLKCADLPRPRQRWQINAVTEELMMPDDHETRIVLWFREIDKGLVLNVTNMRTVSDAYGYQTDDWIGQLIEVRKDKTDFNGKRVDCIRLDKPIEPEAVQANPTRPQQASRPRPQQRPQPQPQPHTFQGDGSDVGESEPF